MNWCILIPLLVGLVSAILGYLLGKATSGGGAKDNSSEIEFWRTKNEQLEADLAACRSKHSSSGSTVASSFGSGNTNVTAADATFNAGAAKSVFGKAIKQDDLTLVQGIGPKIQELFHNYGVNSWKDLGETSVSKCQEILNTGGERYSVHNPGTWPRQAVMAYNGEWKKLKDWQENLDHGKE